MILLSIYLVAVLLMSLGLLSITKRPPLPVVVWILIWPLTPLIAAVSVIYVAWSGCDDREERGFFDDD